MVAVHERYSLWGIHKRYEKEKIAKKWGRFVPLDYHNDCYQKLPETVALIEQQKVVDKIEVYTRDAACLLSNQREGDRWIKSENAKTVLEHERARKLSEHEIKEYKDSWDRVFEYMKKRGAKEDELTAARELARELIHSATSSETCS